MNKTFLRTETKFLSGGKMRFGILVGNSDVNIGGEVESRNIEIRGTAF